MRNKAWVDGDVLDSEDLHKELGNVIWNRIIASDGNENRGFQAHTPLKMNLVRNDSHIGYSADGGVTWTEVNTDLTGSLLHKNCRANREYGVFIENTTDFDVAHTSNAGETVTTKTKCTFGNSISSISYPTTSLIVVGGNDAAGTDHIVFSTDSGATWTNATTTTDAAVGGLDMYDGTTGFAVTTAGKIFKTVNSAVDWTDTGHTVNASTFTNVVAISSSKCVISGIISGSLYIYVYDGTGNAVNKLLVNRPSETAFNLTLGADMDSNGVIYTGSAWDALNGYYQLLRSIDDGETWQSIQVPCVDDIDIDDILLKSAISIDSSDNMYVHINPQNLVMQLHTYWL